MMLPNEVKSEAQGKRQNQYSCPRKEALRGWPTTALSRETCKRACGRPRCHIQHLEEGRVVKELGARGSREEAGEANKLVDVGPRS